MKIFIKDAWYDLTNWAPHHPGGSNILQHFDDTDATDAFFSLHSEAAVERLARMKSAQPSSLKTTGPPTPPGAVDEAYRRFRAQLQKDGWFRRSVFMEALLLCQVVALAAFGSWMAWDYPLLAAFCIGLAMQQAGWLGHDMKHSRNSSYCHYTAPVLAGWVAGMDGSWWSEKHNTHHVLTNHVGIDPDIDNRPVFYLWAPPKAMDGWWRRFQHYYVFLAYFLLYVSWRVQSLKTAMAAGDLTILLFHLLPGYIWLASLPLAVSVGAVLIGGFFVAIVVTLSHESEEMKTVRELSFVRNQFETTCDIICSDPVTSYFFGGMQHQLVHHLFPTLPRYKYGKLVFLVKRFAKDNGLEYKSLPLFAMIKNHLRTLKDVSCLPAKEKNDERVSVSSGGYGGRWRSQG